jgi:hypothetical protein
MKLNRFNCRWSQGKPGVNPGEQWLPLLDGHGALRWPGSTSPSGRGQLEWLPSDDSTAITLPIESAHVPVHAVRYLESKATYFISPVAPRRQKDAQPGCVPLVTLHPTTKRVESQCAPEDALSEESLTFAPSAAGVVRALHQRRTYHGPKPGGLYLTDTRGKTSKIYESRVSATQISPDGCRLAFVHSREGALATSLGMLNFCGSGTGN